MNGAHIHLLVNHAPLFGALFALALLAASYLWAPDVLRRTALVCLVGAGLAGAAADLTGDPAEHAIIGMPGVQRSVIHAHEEFADKSFIAASVIGVLALAALVRWRRAPIPAGAAGAALLGALVVSAMMAWTAQLGGRVRHTEIRPGATKADAMAIDTTHFRGPPKE